MCLAETLVWFTQTNKQTNWDSWIIQTKLFAHLEHMPIFEDLCTKKIICPSNWEINCLPLETRFTMNNHFSWLWDKSCNAWKCERDLSSDMKLKKEIPLKKHWINLSTLILCWSNVICRQGWFISKFSSCNRKTN